MLASSHLPVMLSTSCAVRMQLTVLGDGGSTCRLLFVLNLKSSNGLLDWDIAHFRGLEETL